MTPSSAGLGRRGDPDSTRSGHCRYPGPVPHSDRSRVANPRRAAEPDPWSGDTGTAPRRVSPATREQLRDLLEDLDFALPALMEGLSLIGEKREHHGQPDCNPIATAKRCYAHLAPPLAAVIWGGPGKFSSGYSSKVPSVHRRPELGRKTALGPGSKGSESVSSCAESRVRFNLRHIRPG